MEWWVVIKSQRKVTGPCVSKTWALGCSWLCNRVSMVKGWHNVSERSCFQSVDKSNSRVSNRTTGDNDWLEHKDPNVRVKMWCVRSMQGGGELQGQANVSSSQQSQMNLSLWPLTLQWPVTNPNFFLAAAMQRQVHQQQGGNTGDILTILWTPEFLSCYNFLTQQEIQSHGISSCFKWVPWPSIQRVKAAGRFHKK